MLVDVKVLQVVVLNLLVGVEFSGCLNDLFIVNQYQGAKYFCITNSSFALSWNEDVTTTKNLSQVSRFLPISPNYWNVDCEDFHEQQWKCESWISRKIIRDRRWEGIQVYKTDYVDANSSYTLQFTTINETLSDNFQLALSIRIEQEAHIFLCESDRPTESNCYWLILQGFQGKTSGIRKCPKNAIHSLNGHSPKDPCKNLIKHINHTSATTKFLSKDKWNHFILSKLENRLIFKNFDGKEILSYEDSNFYPIKYLIIHSKGNTGLWKIHKFEYFKTTQSKSTEFETPVNLIDGHICMSMFVRMCKTCKMRIEIKNVNNKNEVLSEETYTSKQQTEWSEITFSKSIVDATQVLLAITTFDGNTDRNRFWAISDVKQCHKDGFRMIEFNDMVSCQLMVPETEVISLNNQKPVTSSSKSDFDPDHCGGETVTKYCIPCVWFLKENCGALKVCERSPKGSKCSCSAGYTNDEKNNCAAPCPDKTYGHECKKHCSIYCNECNKVNGTCTSCLNEYKGLKCDIPPVPIFKNAPTVSNVSYNMATITMENFDVSLKSESNAGSYQTYTIQHKRADVNDQSWITYPENYKIGQTIPVTIRELKPGTKYKVRSVVSSAEDYDGDEVQIMEFTTRCDDIKEEDFVVNSSNTTANLTVLEKRRSYICTFKSFKVMIQPGSDSDHITDYAEPFNIQMRGLKPLQNYKVSLTVNEDYNNKITKSFNTTEGIPEKVKNLVVEPLGDTTVKLKWEEPANIYGYFQSYFVKSRITQYLACDGDPISYDTEATIKSTTTSATIANLNPYTKYMCYVFAKNREHDGLATYIYVNTFQSDSISDEEIPKLESKKIYSRVVLLQFSKISCSKFKGPLLIAITLKCSEQWCTRNKTQKLEYSQSSVKKQISVLPFSSYTLILKFCRNASVCSPVTKQFTFQTEVNSPNIVTNLSVFSKNSTSISVRWQPPYPPTGILKLYNIRSVLKSSNERRDLGNVSNSPCNLWPEFQCFTLTGLQANQIYSVQLRAKNEKPDTFGQVTATEAITKTEPSKRPPGLEILWTLDNDLRVTWEHPTEANGDITHFKISVLSSLSNQKPQIHETLQVTKEQYTAQYHFDVPANKLLPSTEYKITVSAFNGLDGEAAFLMDFSPPEIPTFKTESKLQTSNHSIEVETYGLQNFTKNNKYKLFILVSDEHAETISHPAELQMFKNKLSKFRSIFTCNQYNASEKFVIGGSSNSTTNCKANETLNLRPGSHYTVTIVLTNTDRNKTSYKFYTHEAYTSGKAPEEPKDLTLLALLTLLLIIPIAIIIFYKRRYIVEKAASLKENIFGDTSNDTEAPEEETPLSTVPKMIRSSKKVHSKRVKISDLEQYVKESLKSGELERQHSLFPRGQTKPWECGALKENKSKNRYTNLIAYDHTRVVLKEANSDAYSDYINANYIDGYQIAKSYIATQGPKMNTINDFWKMIWQENVRHIAMLANVYEGGKKKVEKYWPDTNQTLVFGNVSVNYVSSTVYADYEHRVFQLVNGEASRELHQYHFSSWPDHGVPLYSQSLVPFLQTLQRTTLESTSPIVVHCSAGVGRTGTILLCDICLRMAAKENAVDMLKTLHKLRDQRPNMVDNFPQYKLAHLVILEYLLGMKTGIPCSDIHSEVQKLLESGGVTKQLRYLEKTAWQDQTMKSVVNSQDLLVVEAKNRFQEIIPEAQGYIYLSRYPYSDDSSIYINAVNVDGFQNPNRFVVTQQPMPNTLGDFWRLIHEKEVSVIISLNEINLEEKTSCRFWPTEQEDLNPVDYIALRHANTLSWDFHDLITLHMYTSESDEHRVVEILNFKNWAPKSECPPGLEAFLSFYEESNVATRQSKPVVVTCFDGALASGLYVALSFVMEKMKLEQICDVSQAVRSIRHNRSQFVRSEKQFEFLYQAAVAYIDGFQSYANFKN